MHYDDVRKFTRAANYSVNISWRYLRGWIDEMLNESHGFDDSPDFQRAHVWKQEQQRRYVEYVLREGMGSRDIYMNCPGWMGDFRGPLVVVDGKQRLTAVMRFLNDDLRVFPDKFDRPMGWSFGEIEGRLPMSASFVVHINDLDTRAEVLQWYLDINDGGVAHTEDELEVVRGLLRLERGAGAVRTVSKGAS